MLWTPGNPPLSVPGEGDGLMGALGARLFERRQAPLSELLEREAGDPWTVDELLPLLMAAQEPPAAGLTWVLERLARDPDARFGDAYLREVLRLRPPAFAALRRLTEERGGGNRRCLGEHLAQRYFDVVVPAVLRTVRLRPAWPRPERMVLRGTILVPHRSGLVQAS